MYASAILVALAKAGRDKTFWAYCVAGKCRWTHYSECADVVTLAQSDVKNICRLADVLGCDLVTAEAWCRKTDWMPRRRSLEMSLAEGHR